MTAPLPAPPRILAFDPGPHTGWAVLDSDGHLASLGTELLTGTIESNDINELYRQTYATIRTQMAWTLLYPMEIVVESFITVSAAVSATREGIITARLVGFLEGTALILNGRPARLQRSGVRKAFETMAQTELQRIKQSAPTFTYSVHQVSALAHAYAARYRMGAALNDLP